MFLSVSDWRTDSFAMTPYCVWCFLFFFLLFLAGQAETRFTNDFSIAIQIRWKFRFTLTHLDSNTAIATKFCTWHGSCAVVACGKMCCDLMAFHRIWIAGKKIVSETGRCWTNSRGTGDFDQMRIWRHCNVWVAVCFDMAKSIYFFINQYGNVVNRKKKQSSKWNWNYQLSISLSIIQCSGISIEKITVINMKSKSSISFSIIRCSGMSIDSLPNKGLQFCDFR